MKPSTHIQPPVSDLPSGGVNEFLQQQGGQQEQQEGGSRQQQRQQGGEEGCCSLVLLPRAKGGAWGAAADTPKYQTRILFLIHDVFGSVTVIL
jgi:hypothetical protein